jgi:putative ABC transport system permease protein
MALGAGRGRVLGTVLGRAAGLAALGISIGAVLAVAAGQAMQSLLAGVSPTDTQTLAGAAVLALFVTLAGSLVPALRAARIDPLVAMRTE